MTLASELRRRTRLPCDLSYYCMYWSDPGRISRWIFSSWLLLSSTALRCIRTLKLTLIICYASRVYVPSLIVIVDTSSKSQSQTISKLNTVPIVMKYIYYLTSDTQTQSHSTETVCSCQITYKHRLPQREYYCNRPLHATSSQMLRPRLSIRKSLLWFVHGNWK